jgi:hypothetical protein
MGVRCSPSLNELGKHDQRVDDHDTGATPEENESSESGA